MKIIDALDARRERAFVVHHGRLFARPTYARLAGSHQMYPPGQWNKGFASGKSGRKIPDHVMCVRHELICSLPFSALRSAIPPGEVERGHSGWGYGGYLVEDGEDK